ncbi:outer membrane protein [Pseudorhodobacter sp. W20_MBD10_FR17]|uniref:outer membrane protein n=1 Tax=Pseudorhodobacter sp. W20_MBD10_FR17 TaxID=3240266 RepID=UPI003F986585
MAYIPRSVSVSVATACFLVSSFAAPFASAQESAFASLPTASVTYGPYARFELGAARKSVSGGYWQPPGFPNDPQVNFDLDTGNSSFKSIAYGYDWQNGFRGDISLSSTGSTKVSGPCQSASNGSSCSTHADITNASVSTTALMGNLFYSPMEQRGSNSVFQPFVVAGIGLARNKVGTWTRDNGGLRSFEGDTNTDVAFSVGFGASMQVTRPGKWPVIIEAAWRYYDYGTASGSSTPLDLGAEPVTPLTFENREQVISLGVRIPLKRY